MLLGGFATAYSDGAVVEDSLWDVNFRPTCSPRGMTLSPDGQVWVDIYLADTEYTLHGYSRPDVTIADGGSTPVVPYLYGGDGSTTYGSLTWFEANDLAIAAGKRLPHWGEFTGFAYGVVEQQSVGVDPVSTKYQAGHRSACGVEQVAGVMNQWGADVQGSGTGWAAITDGRGSVYASSLTAVSLGSSWERRVVRRFAFCSLEQFAQHLARRLRGCVPSVTTSYYEWSDSATKSLSRGGG